MAGNLYVNFNFMVLLHCLSLSFFTNLECLVFHLTIDCYSLWTISYCFGFFCVSGLIGLFGFRVNALRIITYPDIYLALSNQITFTFPVMENNDSCYDSSFSFLKFLHSKQKTCSSEGLKELF